MTNAPNSDHNVHAAPFNDNHREYQFTLFAPNVDLAGLVKDLRDAGVKLHIAGCPKAARDVAKAANVLEALSWKGS